MRLFASALVAVVLVTTPSAAAADGLPLPIEDVGPAGVADSQGEYRYVTIKDGPNTILERVEQDGGEVSDSIRLPGLYTIPAVGLDGSPGGLSADGETLVLIRPRPSFPRATTEFLRFDADDLRHPRELRLDGDFSFDALSPDGRTMYLINYLSPRDPTEYAVRSYDLVRERLLPGRITDPNESGDEMYGFALSRVTSADGRWGYTLYYGREHPFIHALDTVNGTAACIDLEAVAARTMYTLTLSGDGDDGLVVSRRGTPVAVVDTETHEVGEPGAADANAASSAAASPAVATVAVAAGAALIAAALWLALRRRGRAPA